MVRTRPLAFLDTTALVTLSAIMLATASWARLTEPVDAAALVNPDEDVAVALVDDALPDEEGEQE